MNGVYVHIPFCKSKCYYCDFYSLTGTGGQDAFSGLILEEIALRAGYPGPGPVDTIYFGGGTPTHIPVGQLEKIVWRLKEVFEIADGAEITLEANPDDLDFGRLRQYLDMGFNRISIGTQSFFDAHLRFMNRRHNAAQAIEAVRMARDEGFENISIDLIYGIPGMTRAEWEENLITAADLGVAHISAYHLTIEPGTQFGKLKKAGLLTEISGEQSVEEYRLLRKILYDWGFEQYEISNFARGGKFSRHNTKYWTGQNYLGLGPSAHSFNGTGRHWNPASLVKYTADIRMGRLPAGETIDALTRRNEYVMTRLRMAQGIGTREFSAEFGEEALEEWLRMAGKYIRQGQLIAENGRIFFDPDAWFRSDGILADLFLVR